MTRTDAEAEREALKQEIKGELKREAARRKLAGCGGCALLLAVILAIPTIITLSTLAKSGFVDVPLFSGWLYRPSEPLRIVRPLAGSTPEQVMHSVTSRIAYDREFETLTMTAGEVQLTTLAQVLLEDPKHLPFAGSSVQIAVDPSFVEVYFVSVRPKRNATVRVRVVPKVMDGVIAFETNEILIGGLKVPAFLADYAMKVFGDESRKAMQDFSNEVGELRSITLGEGMTSIVIRPLTH